MSIALLSAIIDPLIDYFNGIIRSVKIDFSSKFNVEVDDYDED